MWDSETHTLSSRAESSAIFSLFARRPDTVCSTPFVMIERKMATVPLSGMAFWISFR